MTPRLLVALAGLPVLTLAMPSAAVGIPGADTGRARADVRPRAVAAAFAERSYAPGAHAELVLWSAEREVRVQVFRAGLERAGARARRADELRGAPVTEPRRVRWSRARRGARIRLPLGIWPSGLYFARVTSGRRVGFAPFVLRPEQLGEHRVAVVLPTYTWQAYNFRDVDRDGVGDTWYADESVRTVSSTVRS